MPKLITLEQLLKTKGVTEFKVSVQQTFDRGVLFIIHPDGVDGDTLDFMVSDNLLTDPKGGRLNRLSRTPEAAINVDEVTINVDEKVTITPEDVGTIKI